MSRLYETKKAYDQLIQLLDQEMRKRTGPTKNLEEFRETLDTAFYALGWAQFEHLVRKEAEIIINDKAKAKTIERHAWKYLKDNIKNVTIRNSLDLVFNAKHVILAQLNKEYIVRNDIAHANGRFPNDTENMSEWLNKLAEIVDEF